MNWNALFTCASFVLKTISEDDVVDFGDYFLFLSFFPSCSVGALPLASSSVLGQQTHEVRAPDCLFRSVYIMWSVPCLKGSMTHSVECVYRKSTRVLASAVSAAVLYMRQCLCLYDKWAMTTDCGDLIQAQQKEPVLLWDLAPERIVWQRDLPLASLFSRVLCGDQGPISWEGMKQLQRSMYDSPALHCDDPTDG